MVEQEETGGPSSQMLGMLPNYRPDNLITLFLTNLHFQSYQHQIVTSDNAIRVAICNV